MDGEIGGWNEVLTGRDDENRVEVSEVERPIAASRWVGEWVGYGKVEEIEAVRVSYWT